MSAKRAPSNVVVIDLEISDHQFRGRVNAEVAANAAGRLLTRDLSLMWTDTAELVLSYQGNRVCIFFGLDRDDMASGRLLYGDHPNPCHYLSDDLRQLYSLVRDGPEVYLFAIEGDAVLFYHSLRRRSSATLSQEQLQSHSMSIWKIKASEFDGLVEEFSRTNQR